MPHKLRLGSHSYLHSNPNAHPHWKIGLCAVLFGVALSGCAADRMLPMAMMPTPPKECEQVLGFTVDPLPRGKSNAAKLSVDMTKEGAARQQEHAVSRVCAEYALRTAGVMKDREAPASVRKGVEPARTTIPTKPIGTGNGTPTS